jgi:hypothetical protein
MQGSKAVIISACAPFASGASLLCCLPSLPCRNEEPPFARAALLDSIGHPRRVPAITARLFSFAVSINYGYFLMIVLPFRHILILNASFI